ncbi:MAG: MFS transporter [Candidatus Dormibacteria bacterium]|jgi:EmrB/QacA subfamily drug resistance transporter
MTDQRVPDRVAGVEAASDRATTSRGNRKWWALSAVCLGCLAVGVDGTVLSVALPTLSKALNASESDLQWFMSIYFLVMAASMLPAGLLGDRFGRKRVMLLALGLFAVGSAGSAFSTSVAEFMATRVLMGMAGAGIIVMAVSAVTVLFTAKERPKAVGFWAAANFISFPIGPILGGWMLTEFWWGWVFLINVPVALLGLTALIALVPETRAAKRPGIDILGIAASAAGLVTLTYGLIEAGQNGWGDIGALTLMIVGVAVLVGFLLWEGRLSRLAGGQPLLDMKLFTSASFTWGVILAALPVLAMISILFTLPQYFQGVVGTDAMGSGLRLLPMIAGLMLGAIPAAQVVRVVGAKVVVAAGFFLLAVGLLVGAMTSLSSTGLFTAAWMFVAGMGVGMSMATATSAALVELSRERSGVGGAVLQAVNKIGGPMGTAILGSVLSVGYLAGLHLAGLPAAAATAVRQSIFGGVAVADRLGSASLLASVRTSFVGGMDTALLLGAAIAAGGAVVTIVFLPQTNSAKETAVTVSGHGVAHVPTSQEAEDTVAA